MKDTEQIKQAVEQLQDKEMIILTIETTSTDKLSIQVAQHVSNPNQEGDLLYLLNKSDERFKRKPRRVWLSTEPSDAKELFPTLSQEIDSVVESGKPVFIGNKKLPTEMGLNIEIRDHQSPSESDLENIDSAAKKTSSGQFMLKNGEPIFTKLKVFPREPNHQIIEADEFTDSLTGAGMQTFQAENQEEELDPVIA